MTVFPARAAAGMLVSAFTGTDTTTISPARAASSAVAARACGPSSVTRSASVRGPRELLSTTWYPAATASRATVPPMLPLPMNPIVVMPGPTGDFVRIFRPAGASAGEGRGPAKLAGEVLLDRGQDLRVVRDRARAEPGGYRAVRPDEEL